jgi:hypothetical protein
MNTNGARTSATDSYSSLSYGVDPTRNFDGEALWTNLVLNQPNISLVLCGHELGPPYTAYREDKGASGNIVHQLFQNYQTLNNGDTRAMLYSFSSRGVVNVYNWRTSDGALSGEPAYSFVYP